jgi:hypothetical protein
MPRTLEQLEHAARQAEARLDDLDPETTPADTIEDLRAIARAVATRAEAERRIAEAVARAREHGRSWARIALVLGISRQAAQERYGKLART